MRENQKHFPMKIKFERGSWSGPYSINTGIVIRFGERCQFTRLEKVDGCIIGVGLIIFTIRIGIGKFSEIE
jgi:hypothetical protein